MECKHCLCCLPFAAVGVNKTVNQEAKQKLNNSDANKQEKREGEQEDNRDKDYSDKEDPEEASEVEEEEKVDEKSVNLEDEIQDLAEELEASRFIGKHQASIMKPMLYNWLDSNGRQKVTVDFLVQSLPEDHFRPKVSSDGMYLELGIVVPDFFYNKGRLIEASGNKRKGHQVGSSHHKVTAFAQAVNDIKAGDDYEETIVCKHVKLPFKLERDFRSDDHGPGWELQAFAHDNEDLFQMHQCYFVLTVELESFIKPCKSKISGKKALRAISSPMKPTQDNEDPYNDEDSEIVMQS